MAVNFDLGPVIWDFNTNEVALRRIFRSFRGFYCIHSNRLKILTPELNRMNDSTDLKAFLILYLLTSSVSWTKKTETYDIKCLNLKAGFQPLKMSKNCIKIKIYIATAGCYNVYSESDVYELSILIIAAICKVRNSNSLLYKPIQTISTNRYQVKHF